jgi:hypothetical protein
VVSARGGKLGKMPAQPARLQLKLTPTLSKLPDPPEKVDYSQGVYPMYGNDQYGDCVEAGIGHQIGQYTEYAERQGVLFTNEDILGAYSAITGFSPDDPNTDQGTYTQDAMAWWRKTGLKGHAIVMYAALDLTNVKAIKQAIATFGAVGIGFNFPAYAMDQFDAGKPWDVQKKNAQIEGGHYVIATGYDGTYLDTKTWGADQQMSWAFLAKYADEAWVVLDDEMVGNAGTFWPGLDLYGLGEDFAALTGQSNPFPEPQPDPNPTPDPVPTPVGPSAAQVAQAVRNALTEVGV